jgi:poly-gamma-glutamate capsule biosynthesis protein CapA/YwtB (metallophosphatase superfamily)
VNAHHAATECKGVRDGVQRGERWLPFQGGHYRLSNRSREVREHQPISPEGEIHLGPGWQLLEHGALVAARGDRYRANASHNAGIIYHEYGHHLTRHTADFRANSLRRPDRQSNRKTALDEGVSDYWAATMLDSPHIWAWHHRHDAQEVHARSLVSPKIMADHDPSPNADPHANGTIWAAALWDLRTRIAATDPEGARTADRMLLQSLLLFGCLVGDEQPASVASIRRAREGFGAGLTTLLQADERMYAGRYRQMILDTFARRGIRPPSSPAPCLPEDAGRDSMLLRHMPREDLPQSEALLSAESLAEHVGAQGDPALSLLVAGDIMLGGRARRAIAEHGADHPLQAVRPLLQQAPVVLGNLEGPFARKAKKLPRTHSYRVPPKLATALKRAGINVVSLANNHLLDCGRAGVLETLEALEIAGIAALGAGPNEQAAHAPRILEAGPYRVGLLGYYWNHRTAATADLPGSARDTREAVKADIRALRQQADRVVVTCHWGIPYDREPSPEDRAKARWAVDCGADAVFGHHPHLVQPFEIYRGCPIFYSVGNFAFGSGNSRAEGLLVGLRFEERETTVYVYPLYVKNRDPRVDYQPKVLRGQGAERVLHRLMEVSGPSGAFLTIEEGIGRIHLSHSHNLGRRRHELDV